MIAHVNWLPHFHMPEQFVIILAIAIIATGVVWAARKWNQ